MSSGVPPIVADSTNPQLLNATENNAEHQRMPNVRKHPITSLTLIADAERLDSGGSLHIDTPAKSAGAKRFGSDEDDEQDAQPAAKKLKQEEEEALSTFLCRILSVLTSEDAAATLGHVRKEVLQYALATNKQFKDIWRCLVLAVLNQTLHNINNAFACTFPATGTKLDVKLTSGVSYIRPTESTTLPHIVIRPPNLTEYPAPDPTVTPTVCALSTQSTATVVLPWQGDDAIRDYLLFPEKRVDIIATSGGKESQVIQGLNALPALLTDRSFVCLNYCLEVTDGGLVSLVPCLDTKSSDVQIACGVRRGVGGSGPLKIAERALHGDRSFTVLVDGSLDVAPFEDSLKTQQTVVAKEGAVVVAPSPFSVATDTSNVVVENGVDGAVAVDEQQVLATEDKHQEAHAEEEDDAQDAAAMQEETKSNNTDAQQQQAVAQEESEGSTHHYIGMYTHSCRLELYVAEEKWHSLNSDQRNVLYSVVRHSERGLIELMHKESVNRLKDCCSELQVVVSKEKDVEDLNENFAPGGTQEMSYETAVVQAAACMTAAAACGIHSPTLKLQTPWPLYLISTRDSFSLELIPVEKTITLPNSNNNSNTHRPFTAVEWYFKQDQAPPDSFWSTVTPIQHNMQMLLPTGIITYPDVFTERELVEIERAVDELDDKKNDGLLPPSCFHATRGRTKFFFGARYLWLKGASDPNASVAAGVRVDVPVVPKWIKPLVEERLTDTEIMPEGFANSMALNIYHDASEGIQSHFDDARRFDRPVYSLRLFSDSRLSFGGVRRSNHAYYVPLKRGTVCIMGGFSADKIKHCIRTFDLCSKSAGLILRRIAEPTLNEAKAFHYEETMEMFENLNFEDVDVALEDGGDEDRVVGLSKVIQRYRQAYLKRKAAKESAVSEAFNDEQHTRLLLASIVGSVETAERCRLLLGSEDDCEVFTILDNLVSLCEMVVQ